MRSQEEGEAKESRYRWPGLSLAQGLGQAKSKLRFILVFEAGARLLSLFWPNITTK